ncbi:MAG TPA: DNA polymerase III subunit gamma/tau [Acidimicrobiales bacterium]|nr:DNA polymerase III subunit gamma/tau [Acidimicrobiales bacterium]
MGDGHGTVAGTNAGDGGEPFVSLYRRFRPGRFGELKGQPHVVRALQTAVRDSRVAHAYLFSGPRGTGKTSTARILAKALNCADPQGGEPCGVCSSCVEISRGNSLDVHELDAASNNGVDAMRDLVSHAALGTPGRSKVYIVDEVHMLSNAAANALLKTLEEPPAHVVFVLATTDPQKVPATIRSRTQHFDFRLLATDTLSQLLHEVRDRAGLPLDDDALSVAVRRGRGSARDALSALDQVVASGSADDVVPEIAEVLQAIADDDGGRALLSVASLHEAGWGPQQLATELVEELRQAFLSVLAPELAGTAGVELQLQTARAERLGLPRLVRAMEVLGRAQVDMRDAPDPRVVLEVAVVRLARPELDDSPAALLDRLARLERGQGAPPARPPEGPAAHPAQARVPAAASTGPGVAPPRGGEAADAASRPTIGALRRRQAAAGGPGTPAVTPPPPPSPPPPSPPPGAGATGDLPPEPVRTRPPGTAPPEPARPGQADPSPSGRAEPPDRDTLVQAWGDGVLASLPPKAKALFGAGRFVSVQDGVAVFALPSVPHRDKCDEIRGPVEEAIAAGVGARVRLKLVVEAPASSRPAPEGGPSGRPAGPGTTGPGTGAAAGLHADLGEDDFDPDDPGVPVEIESIARSRLLEAFPGAEEVKE